jgi:hypothetical protein
MTPDQSMSIGQQAPSTPSKKIPARRTEITVDITCGIMSFSPFGSGFLAQW